MIVGLYADGGQLIELNSRTYACGQYAQLETDIEAWLNSNGISYQDVTVTWTTDNTNPTVTIDILQTEIAFNHVRTYHLSTGGRRGTDHYFSQSNCTSSPINPTDICEICEAKGYDCRNCPYWEIEPACAICNQLNIPGGDCSACSGAGSDCDRCTDLGYSGL